MAGNPNPSPATRFKKGNPGGAGRPPYLALTKLLREGADELIASAKTGEVITRGEAVCRTVWKLAIEGDMRAVKFIFDRSEGKVPDLLRVFSENGVKAPVEYLNDWRTKNSSAVPPPGSDPSSDSGETVQLAERGPAVEKDHAGNGHSRRGGP